MVMKKLLAKEIAVASANGRSITALKVQSIVIIANPKRNACKPGSLDRSDPGKWLIIAGKTMTIIPSCRIKRIWVMCKCWPNNLINRAIIVKNIDACIRNSAPLRLSGNRWNQFKLYIQIRALCQSHSTISSCFFMKDVAKNCDFFFICFCSWKTDRPVIHSHNHR